MRYSNIASCPMKCVDGHGIRRLALGVGSFLRIPSHLSGSCTQPIHIIMKSQALTILLANIG